MQKLFGKSEVFDSDIYVADYTRQGKGGVVMNRVPFADINSFHLAVTNPPTPYLAVNLEEYPRFTEGIKNCEAVMTSLHADGDSLRWTLFLELKYCGPRKIPDYGPSAIDQMDVVRKKLEAEGLLSSATQVYHYNYCVPSQPDAEPFDGFRETQSATLDRVEGEGVIFHARMELMALDGSIIEEPPVAI